MEIGIITAITGLVGTIGGVMISYLTLKHAYDKDKHKIKVEFGKGHLINVPGIDASKEQFTIKVANLSSIPFTVAMVGINIGRYSGGLAIPQPLGTHPIPVTLERDQTCNFWIDYKEAAKSIKKYTGRSSIKVRANISDYTSKNFHSKWLKIQFRETKYSRAKKTIGKLFRDTRKKIIP